MKILKLILFAVLMMTIVQTSWAAGRTRPLGTIAGTVFDDDGRTISGALVKLMDEEISSPTIQFIRADQHGNFYAKNIRPGGYRLRAEARGFLSEVKPIQVRPDVVLSLRFELKRLDTMLDHRTDRNAYRWIVRGGPRPVLRLHEGTDTNAELATIFNANHDRPRLVNGMVQFVGGMPFSQGDSSDPFAGVNIALAGHAAPNLELVFVGQAAAAAGYPGRLELIASTFATDEHQLTARLGYAKLHALGESGSTQDIGQLSMALLDSWQVSGPVVVVYGVDMTRYLSGNPHWAVSPRLGLSVTADSATRLSAEYFPVSSQEVVKQGQFNYEGGQVIFADPQQLALMEGQVQTERSRRLQLAVERQLDEASSVEAAFFFDEFAGRGVGLLSVPSNVTDTSDQTWHALTQQGQARGARVMYQRELTPHLTGMVGYSMGQGQKYNPATLEPSDIFQSSWFHVVSLQLNATVTRTRTRISTTYRLGTRNAAFAIDPFYGRTDVFDPSLNVMVTQELPDLGLLPGRWEASVDARNLLDQQETASLDGRTVVLGPSHRMIRGSVSVRF